MKILQFLCPQDPPASQLKLLMVDQVNTWSRLQRLSSDPDYVTQPFDASIWHEHTTTPGLWWLDYDSVYAHIGDDGRKIADQMLGNGALQGILKMAPLVQALPGTKLELVEVADPIAAGYLPEPSVQPIEPTEP
jgi:hypothetical protein